MLEYKLYLKNENLRGMDSLPDANHNLFGTFQTNDKIDICDIFEIEGEYYNVCSMSCSENTAVIEPIDINEDCDETYREDNMVCPFCGYTDYDSWEYEDGTNEINCPNCNAELEMEKEIEVTYTTTLKKKPQIKNIERKGN